MTTIPFKIQMKETIYCGFLGTSDLSDPPTSFFVFMGDFVVGYLLFEDKWIFNQAIHHKFLNKLDTSECSFIAECLGHIAVLHYQLSNSKRNHPFTKCELERFSLISLRNSFKSVVKYGN